MSGKVLISADSTCDLPPELCERLNIITNSLPIIRGGEKHLDGVDITPDEVFEYYNQTRQLVKTCASNTEEYAAFFKPLLEEDVSIVHFIISSDMSASYNNCRVLAEETPGLYVIDSRNLSTGIALLVFMAATLRDQGLTAAEIQKEVSAAAAFVDASFTIDTLEYLHKGGRCTALAALGANLLKLKPCIEVKNGQMGVGKKYRGKLPDVLREYVAARLADPEDIDTTRCFITHSGCDPEIVESVKKQVETLISFDEILVTRAGCSISVHCGPNTLGILFIRKTAVK